ncbi:MAG: DASS family sodium-coupled anion symporter [Actinomycetaceae bacterium]|nr:DASS family sodium-coupled anion symporter [Actinomycetaceae bacterium]
MALAGFLVPFFVDIPGLDEPGQRMLSIFMAAVALWISEAIPLVATAVLVIFAEVLLISDQALLPVTDQAAKASEFYASLANPVIILFLGGFMIADGAEKYHLDKALAATLLRPFLGSPRLTLMGLMMITAGLSMFMSNTATTATMFAILLPVLKGLPPGKSRTGIALSIPVAANVGGMGTPVGTPPNAIAIAGLREAGITVSFVEWMVMAIPLMLIVLAISWVWLAVRYIPRDVKFNINLEAKYNTTGKAKIFYLTAGVTILLWMSENLHGISSNTVGFLPVVVLLCLKVMDGDDLNKLDWSTLWLVAGGIALGKGVGASGLDKWLIGSIPWASMPSALLLTGMALIGFAMSNVISHSASANLLVPLGVGLAATVSTSSVHIAVILGLGCSLGMSLPISTPPNAIAYASKEVPTKEMAFTGLVVGIAGVVLLAVFCPPYWHLLGIA